MISAPEEIIAAIDAAEAALQKHIANAPPQLSNDEVSFLLERALLHLRIGRTFIDGAARRQLLLIKARMQPVDPPETMMAAQLPPANETSGHE